MLILKTQKEKNIGKENSWSLSVAHTTLPCELEERTAFVSRAAVHWSETQWPACTEGSNPQSLQNTACAHVFTAPASLRLPI